MKTSILTSLDSLPYFTVEGVKQLFDDNSKAAGTIQTALYRWMKAGGSESSRCSKAVRGEVYKIAVNRVVMNPVGVYPVGAIHESPLLHESPVPESPLRESPVPESPLHESPFNPG